MRISVSPIVTLVTNGMTRQVAVNRNPAMELEGIRQALRYAACATEETVYIPAVAPA